MPGTWAALFRSRTSADAASGELIPKAPAKRRDSAGKPLAGDGSDNERCSFILFLPHFYGVRVTRRNGSWTDPPSSPCRGLGRPLMWRALRNQVSTQRGN